MDVDQASALRVPLVTPGTRPDLAPLELRIRAERGRISLLYQVLLNSAPIAAGWEQMLTAVRNRTALAADLRELAILRVAVLNGASFEFDAHVPHAERAGVSPEKLAAIRQAGTIDPVFTPTERMVLALTDAMTRDVEVPDEVFEPLRAEFDAKGLVELVATVAAYNMVSRFLVALRVSH
ncbi:MAG: carboxymuconolactone decarboxylase family protein [Burkholderiaceae bacterium]